MTGDNDGKNIQIQLKFSLLSLLEPELFTGIQVLFSDKRIKHNWSII